ncbi:MAG: TetR/AcrR family transcriptional regulator [Acidobacteriia bacterium]|nr:TetR/AcrR family transcriptional regulator [Terriglobia bacterium]
MKNTRSRKKLRPRIRDSAATRAIILRAAERIFAEVGLAGARTDSIAAAAGVNKAMLYYYFKSKVGLHRAVLEELVGEFQRGALEVLRTKTSASQVLLGYVSYHFDFIAARPYYPRLFQRLAMTGDKHIAPMVRKYFVPLAREVRARIEGGMRSGEFKRLDPTHTAISLAALTVFYFNAAPMIRLIGGFDPYQKDAQERRKQEVLKFIRYALFRDLPRDAESRAYKPGARGLREQVA